MMHMNGKKLISIIIPFYNTPTDLFEKCIESVVQQDYKNTEILVIDDGSSPENLNKILTITKKDSRIRVISQKNGGEGAARNTGINKARGEYIVFVDSDDGLGYGWLSYAMSVVDKSQADIVSGKVVRVTSIPNREDAEVEEPTSFTQLDRNRFWELQRDFLYFSSNLQKGLPLLDPGVCSKLIKRSCVGGVRFPVGIKLSSDQVFNHYLLNKAGKYALTNKISYYYVSNSESVSHVYQPKAADYMMQSMRLIRDQLIENKEVSQAFYYRVLAEITEAIQYAYFSDKNKLCLKEKVQGVRYAGSIDVVKNSLVKMDINSLPNRQWKLKAWLLKHQFYALFVVLKMISDIGEKS